MDASAHVKLSLGEARRLRDLLLTLDLDAE
jgi:hypothetical protein